MMQSRTFDIKYYTEYSDHYLKFPRLYQKFCSEMNSELVNN